MWNDIALTEQQSISQSAKIKFPIQLGKKTRVVTKKCKTLTPQQVCQEVWISDEHPWTSVPEGHWIQKRPALRLKSIVIVVKRLHPKGETDHINLRNKLLHPWYFVFLLKRMIALITPILQQWICGILNSLIMPDHKCVQKNSIKLTQFKEQ